MRLVKLCYSGIRLSPETKRFHTSLHSLQKGYDLIFLQCSSASVFLRAPAVRSPSGVLSILPISVLQTHIHNLTYEGFLRVSLEPIRQIPNILFCLSYSRYFHLIVI